MVSDNYLSEIDNFFLLLQIVYSDQGYPETDPEGDQEEWYPFGKRQIWDSKSLSSLRDNLENTSDVQFDK